MAQFFRSQRGRPKLGYQGYIYQCQRETEHEMRWRCEAREKKGKCPAKAKSMGNTVIVLKAHNHPPDYANVEKEILKRNIIDNAAAQGLSTTSDLSGIISSLPNSLACKMPTMDCMKRAIRRRQNITAQSNRILSNEAEGPLPTSTGTDYYSSLTESAVNNSMDIFVNNNNNSHNISQNSQIFDAKELQNSLYDIPDNNSMAATTNFPIMFEQPLLGGETPNESEQGGMANSGSNNDAMEFFSLLQSQINDLKAENEQLRTQLKTADERLIEIEKRLKINRKLIPADAKFEIARLTLSKIGTFQFFGGSKTVDVASFLRQVAPEEQTLDPRLPRKLFTDCINMILGDSVIYYSYKKNPKEGCCQLDPNLFNCILGLICDGYGLSKDPQKDNDKDKYLRECIMEELNITARKVFKNAADPLKSNPLLSSNNNTVAVVVEPPSSTPQSRPQSSTTVSVKAETEPDPPVYCIGSDDDDSDGY